MQSIRERLHTQVCNDKQELLKNLGLPIWRDLASCLHRGIA